MPSWIIDEPTVLDLDQVTGLKVRLMAGTVAVLATDDRPSVAVLEHRGGARCRSATRTGL